MVHPVLSILISTFSYRPTRRENNSKMNGSKHFPWPQGLKHDDLGPISMINHPSAGLNQIIGCVEKVQVFEVVPKTDQGVILLGAVS
jgi:hypothetical protein